MTWVKLDDHFPDHPKLQALGDDYDAGLSLEVRGLCYCAANLTDGFIPLRKFSNEQTTIDRLVAVGLWEPVDGGYRVHDYLEYNPSRAKVEAERATTRDRVSRWRNGSSNAVSNAVTTSVSNAVGNAAPEPVPERDKTTPTPTPEAAVIDEVVRAAAQRLTASAAAPLVTEYGADRVQRVIRDIDQNPPPEGVRSFPALLADRLRRGGGIEAPQGTRPSRPVCANPDCSSGYYLPSGAESYERCPDCGLLCGKEAVP